MGDLDWLLTTPSYTTVIRGVLTNYEGGDDPIELAHNVRIVPISDSMRETLWRRYGETLVRLVRLDRWAMLNGVLWTHAIEVDYQTPAEQIGNPAPAQDRLRDAEAALAIHAPESVAVAATWFLSDPPWAAHFLNAIPALVYSRAVLGAAHMGELPGEPYTIAARDEAAVRETFERYVARRDDGPLELAVRRYRNAVKERRRVEDRILDYWIAFEALFLPDSNLELNWRASLSIAKVVGASHDERLDLFEFLRASYNARSHVAHGGGSGESFRVKKGEPKKSLDEVTDHTRAVLSAALRA